MHRQFLQKAPDKFTGDVLLTPCPTDEEVVATHVTVRTLLRASMTTHSLPGTSMANRLSYFVYARATWAAAHCPVFAVYANGYEVTAMRLRTSRTTSTTMPIMPIKAVVAAVVNAAVAVASVALIQTVSN